MEPLAILWSEVSAAGTSKRRVTNAEDEELTAIENMISDDLLIEILLQLPLTSLRQSKLVCKRWLSLISDHSFNQLLRNRNPNFKHPSSFVLQLETDSSSFAFVTLNPKNRIPAVKRSPLITSFPFHLNSGYIEVLQSCNGLLLCHAWPDKFYVHNPTTNMSKLLPLPHDWVPNRFVHGMAIAFDPRVSSHYKVIYPRDYDYAAPGTPIKIEICIYSSETGNWRPCAKNFKLASFSAFENGVYWNNAIHWIHYSHEVYNFNFDIDNPHFIKVKTPRRTAIHDDRLLVSSNCLLLLQMVQFHAFFSLKMDVYQMKNDYSGWFIKYYVNLHHGNLNFLPASGSFVVLSLVLGERKQEEDPFLLLEVSGKLIQYNIISKSFHELCDLAPIRPLNSKYCSFMFTPSLAGV